MLDISSILFIILVVFPTFIFFELNQIYNSFINGKGKQKKRLRTEGTPPLKG